MLIRTGELAAAMTALVALTGCVRNEPADTPREGANMSGHAMEASAVERAVAVLSPTEGNKASGTIMFSRLGNEIVIEGKVQGLTPGNHGLHIHEFGDRTSRDGSSTGAHFNPEGMEHGGWKSSARHVGDLGNITADEHGVAEVDRVDSLIALSGPHSILGRGLVIHEGADDSMTQPAGDAGSRIATAVIGVASP